MPKHIDPDELTEQLTILRRAVPTHPAALDQVDRAVQRATTDTTTDRHRPGRKAHRNLYDELSEPLPGDNGTGQHLATAATTEASALITAALNHAEAAGILEPIRQQHAAAALAAHQTFVDEIHAGALEEIREKLRHHLHAGDDPCQDRGVPWPCDVAEALGITE